MINYKIVKNKTVTIHHCPKHGEEKCHNYTRLDFILARLHLENIDKHSCNKLYYRIIPFAIWFAPRWIETRP